MSPAERTPLPSAVRLLETSNLLGKSPGRASGEPLLLPQPSPSPEPLRVMATQGGPSSAFGSGWEGHLGSDLRPVHQQSGAFGTLLASRRGRL